MSIFTNALKLVKSHSPEILTALGVTGVFTTSYLAGKASYAASEIVRAQETEPADRKERFKEHLRLTWKLYIPTGISGAVTVGCIIGASKATGRRTAAAVAAYSITEKAFSEYKEKVVEELGKGKDQKIRDAIVQDHISKDPYTSREVIITGGGNVLCCELLTHRYFRSDMESLKKAVNEINWRINRDIFITMDEFYDLIGLPHTSASDKNGWDSNKQLDLSYSHAISEDGEPCLTFEYNYYKIL